MEFSGQYLTYEEYKALGGTLNLTPFNLLEFESRKQIDLKTQRRLVGVQEIPEEVKLCDFHLINKIESYAKSTNTTSGNVKSENTNGYSVTYITASEIKSIIESKKTELEDIIVTDLFGIVVNGEHILYGGV